MLVWAFEWPLTAREGQDNALRRVSLWAHCWLPRPKIRLIIIVVVVAVIIVIIAVKSSASSSSPSIVVFIIVVVVVVIAVAQHFLRLEFM